MGAFYCAWGHHLTYKRSLYNTMGLIIYLLFLYLSRQWNEYYRFSFPLDIVLMEHWWSCYTFDTICAITLSSIALHFKVLCESKATLPFPWIYYTPASSDGFINPNEVRNTYKSENFLRRNVPLRHLLNAKHQLMSIQRCAFNEVNYWALHNRSTFYILFNYITYCMEASFCQLTKCWIF